MDTGYGGGIRLNQALLPAGGAGAGGVAYVLNFTSPASAQQVDASGAVTPLTFVTEPELWPGGVAGRGRRCPAAGLGHIAYRRCAHHPLWSWPPPAAEDVTPLLNETVTEGSAPYQLVAQRWSDDGQALYFSREPYGIGGYIPFAAASSLYRYNLADGSVTELIPFDPQGGGRMLCLDDISADFSLVVGHCGADPKTLTVVDLAGGPERDHYRPRYRHRFPIWWVTRASAPTASGWPLPWPRATHRRSRAT